MRGDLVCIFPRGKGNDALIIPFWGVGVFTAWAPVLSWICSVELDLWLQLCPLVLFRVWTSRGTGGSSLCRSELFGVFLKGLSGEALRNTGLASVCVGLDSEMALKLFGFQSWVAWNPISSELNRKKYLKRRSDAKLRVSWEQCWCFLVCFTVSHWHGNNPETGKMKAGLYVNGSNMGTSYSESTGDEGID